MGSVKAFVAGAIATASLSCLAWIMSGPPRTAVSSHLGSTESLRNELKALEKEVASLADQVSRAGALPSALPPPDETNPTVPTRSSVAVEQRQEPPEPPTDLDIDLLWRCLHNDRDGVVAALDARGLSPFAAAVKPLVKNVLSQLDDLRLRFPVDIEMVKRRREIVKQLESSLDRETTTPEDRARMQQQIDLMRSTEDPNANTFELERKAIMDAFVAALPSSGK
jgi:hypothetical protein